MRPDLNKLLCERERIGHDNHYSQVRNIRAFKDSDDHFDNESDDFTTGGSRESMKKRHNYHYGRKSFNENLNPLWGLVRKNVGRKWDKFYSELMEVFDIRSVVNHHIIEHLFQRVEINTFVEDKHVYVQDYRGRAEPIWESWTEYFVDPRDGILKRNKWYKTYKQKQKGRAQDRAREQLKVKRVLNANQELHKIGDVWFEIKFVDREGTRREEIVTPIWSKRTYTRYITEYPAAFDVLQGSTSSQKRIAVNKRSLSHKELKEHKLI